MEGFGRALLLEEYVEEDDFGASRPSRYIPSERNALWWGRRGMEPPWETDFGAGTGPEWSPLETLSEALSEANPNVEDFTYMGEDVVPHLCETQWGESDARCIQHLGDPTFGWVDDLY
jgi:hypothetical protein